MWVYGGDKTIQVLLFIKNNKTLWFVWNGQKCTRHAVQIRVIWEESAIL